MTAYAAVVGINMAGLRDAFSGSEDILRQMLVLFESQARERLEQLRDHLAAGDSAAARVALHSLVNISGAVRAYGMSDLAKEVGTALKAGDSPGADQAARALQREGAFVLRQARALLDASEGDAKALWLAMLPAE